MESFMRYSLKLLKTTSGFLLALLVGQLDNS